MHFIINLLSNLVSFVFFIIYLVLVVIALLDILRNGRLTPTVKLLWIIVIFVAPFLGSLLYLFWGKNQRY